MKFIKILNLVSQNLLLTRSFMSMVKAYNKNCEFVSDEKLQKMFNRVSRQYKSHTQNYLQDNNELNTLFFFATTTLASTLFTLQGNFESALKTIDYFLDTTGGSKLDKKNLSDLKALWTINELRRLVILKDKNGLIPEVRQELELLKPKVLSLHTPTFSHLGEQALYYLTIGDAKEATRLLIERANRAGLQRLNEEIYDNRGLVTSPTGQDFMKLVQEVRAQLEHQPQKKLTHKTFGKSN